MPEPISIEDTEIDDLPAGESRRRRRRGGGTRRALGRVLDRIGRRRRRR
ncbi:MAG: hypothetical protein VW907_00495 [Opitutae bacterium]